MAVYIAKNLKKESRVFDIEGNEIDLETKEIIKPKEQPRTLTPEQIAKMEEKLKRQAELEAMGIKPEGWQDVVGKK